MTQEGDSNGKLHSLSSSTIIISDELKEEDSVGANYKYERRAVFQWVSLLTGFNVTVVRYHKRLQLNPEYHLKLLGMSLTLTVSFTKAVRLAYDSSQ